MNFNNAPLATALVYLVYSFFFFLIGVIRCAQQYPTFTIIMVEENKAVPVGTHDHPQSAETFSVTAREEVSMYSTWTHGVTDSRLIALR